MNDNKFIDVVVGVGDSFLQILEKLGLKKQEAEKVIQTMQDQNLLEGTSIRGVWTEDGEIKVAEDTGVKNDDGAYVVRFEGEPVEAIKQALGDTWQDKSEEEKANVADSVRLLLDDSFDSSDLEPRENTSFADVEQNDIEDAATDEPLITKTDFEATAKQRAIQSIPDDGHSAPILDEGGEETGQYITKDGNEFTPVDANGNGQIDQQEAARLEEAVFSIKDGDYGAPLKNADGTYSGYYVNRQGEKYTPVDENGNTTEDHEEHLDWYSSLSDAQRANYDKYGTLTAPSVATGSAADDNSDNNSHSTSYTDSSTDENPTTNDTSDQEPATPRQTIASGPLSIDTVTNTLGTPKSPSEVYADIYKALPGASNQSGITPPAKVVGDRNGDGVVDMFDTAISDLSGKNTTGASTSDLYYDAIADIRKSGMTTAQWAEENEQRIQQLFEAGSSTPSIPGPRSRADVVNILDKFTDDTIDTPDNTVRTDQLLGEKILEYRADDYNDRINQIAQDIISGKSTPLAYANGDGAKNFEDAAAMYMTNNGLDPSRFRLSANGDVIEDINSALRERGYLDNLGHYDTEISEGNGGGGGAYSMGTNLGLKSGSQELADFIDNQQAASEIGEAAMDTVQDSMNWQDEPNGRSFGSADAAEEWNEPNPVYASELTPEMQAINDRSYEEQVAAQVPYTLDYGPVTRESNQAAIEQAKEVVDMTTNQADWDNNGGVIGKHYDLNTREGQIMKAADEAATTGQRMVPIVDAAGNWTGEYATADGNAYVATDANGNGVEDHQEAYFAQEAANSGQYGVPLANADGSWTGMGIRPDGSTYVWADADQDGAEDHAEQAYYQEHYTPAGYQQEGQDVYYYTSDASMVDPNSDNYSSTVASYTTDTTRPPSPGDANLGAL